MRPPKRGLRLNCAPPIPAFPCPLPTLILRPSSTHCHVLQCFTSTHPAPLPLFQCVCKVLHHEAAKEGAALPLPPLLPRTPLPHPSLRPFLPCIAPQHQRIPPLSPACVGSTSCGCQRGGCTSICTATRSCPLSLALVSNALSWCSPSPHLTCVRRFYIMRLPKRGLRFHRITYHAKCTQCLGGLNPVGRCGKVWGGSVKGRIWLGVDMPSARSASAASTPWAGMDRCEESMKAQMWMIGAPHPWACKVHAVPQRPQPRGQVWKCVGKGMIWRLRGWQGAC